MPLDYYLNILNIFSHNPFNGNPGVSESTSFSILQFTLYISSPAPGIGDGVSQRPTDP